MSLQPAPTGTGGWERAAAGARLEARSPAEGAPSAGQGRGAGTWVTGAAPCTHGEPAHSPGYEVIEGQPQNGQQQEHGDGPAAPHGVHVDLQRGGLGSAQGPGTRPAAASLPPPPGRQRVAPWDAGLQGGTLGGASPHREEGGRPGLPPPKHLLNAGCCPLPCSRTGGSRARIGPQGTSAFPSPWHPVGGTLGFHRGGQASRCPL